MRRISWVMPVAFLMLFFAAGPGVAERGEFSARVVAIIDGDTVDIRREGGVRRVRIWGIDTPEWHQPYAAQASALTRDLLLGKDVAVSVKDVDVYGRLVATVTVDRSNVAEELVESGLAWVHGYYCREPICETWKKMQEDARLRRLGLWADDHPIAPWQWKKQHSR